MTDAITAQEFSDSDGVADWTVAAGSAESAGVTAEFATKDFATGLRLVNKIGELAEAANHHPDVDLRYGSVTVRLSSHDIGGLSRRDAKLAAQISRAAAELGLS
ncbi:4a-hydroxytetrahydrobiopterin dehydratase [Nakamurella aerolata]|uniref:Putative pterin-4-alpha-carbinolamine dehydratase n=1 Tax=Nakamurella aerolata TaxID=1656892 RepID=A0A849A474_9ACTN|nr:4a-hydroxytetrahydrobiopterin dehydratase [Nakamurella aerolata]NNG34857.1 4a-hydroxytetrahydrobiopterin dehydratase [Nakamurella aerolata]